MKNILLLVHDDPGQEARFQVALDVARALDAHVNCLDVIELPMIVADYYTGGGQAVLVDDIKRDQRQFAERMRNRLALEDVAWTFEDRLGSGVDAVARAADLADLIVVSSRLHEAGEGRKVRPEALPLKARRPVMAVPPECPGLDLSGNVVMAWDGSHACNEALRSAVPLLKLAGNVTLLEVNDPNGAFAMTEAASYLSRHGIAVELVERTTEDQVADVILAHARHVEAVYIVMGAFSLPRAAQALFGGVTRTMLTQSKVPLLIAH